MTIVPAAKITTNSLELCIISQLNTSVDVYFHVQVNVASCHTTFEVNQAEKLLPVLNIIETLASGVIIQLFHACLGNSQNG